jgi:hypothetical protein
MKAEKRGALRSRRRDRSRVSLGGIFAQGRANSNLDVPVLTVCEGLDNFSQYNGEAVVVVGRLVGTDEGSWLNENCEQKIITGGYAWASSISLTHVQSAAMPPPVMPRRFKWDAMVLQAKLKQVQQATKLGVLKQYHYSDRWFAVFGRFETRLSVQMSSDGGGTPRDYGYGHLNTAPAQLVWNVAGWHKLKPE